MSDRRAGIIAVVLVIAALAAGAIIGGLTAPFGFLPVH